MMLWNKRWDDIAEPLRLFLLLIGIISVCFLLPVYPSLMLPLVVFLFIQRVWYLHRG